jgi:hypothetical protein
MINSIGASRALKVIQSNSSNSSVGTSYQKLGETSKIIILSMIYNMFWVISCPIRAILWLEKSEHIQNHPGDCEWTHLFLQPI